MVMHSKVWLAWEGRLLKWNVGGIVYGTENAREVIHYLFKTK